MDKPIEELYHRAKRFDESDIYQSAEYDAVAKNQMALYKKMRVIFGPAIIPFLEEYTAAMGDEMELECRHFFEQGYRLGRGPEPRAVTT